MKPQGLNKQTPVVDFSRSITSFLCLCFFNQAYANLSIRPMLVYHEAVAGQSTEIVLRLQNTSTSIDQHAIVQFMELIQTDTGRYIPTEPNEPNVPSNRSSCLRWLSLQNPTNGPFKVPPKNKKLLHLTVNAPPKAEGFYCASVMITQLPDSPSGLIATKIEYVIPILITLKNRPGVCRVDLTKVGLEYAQVDANDVTRIYMDIHNTGQTYNQLKALAQISTYHCGMWIPCVYQLKIDELSIIPGSKLKLKTLLPFLLTPGYYEAIGCLAVDEDPAVMLKKRVHLTKKN